MAGPKCVSCCEHYACVYVTFDFTILNDAYMLIVLIAVSVVVDEGHY